MSVELDEIVSSYSIVASIDQLSATRLGLKVIDDADNPFRSSRAQMVRLAHAGQTLDPAFPSSDLMVSAIASASHWKSACKLVVDARCVVFHDPATSNFHLTVING